MPFALLQHADRALDEARGYVYRLVDKVATAVETRATFGPTATPEALPQGVEDVPDLFAVIPSDILLHILSFLDVGCLVDTVPFVCKRWRAEAASLPLWRNHLSPKLVEQLEPLAALGDPVGPAHLYLALRGRNFLRNPAFRRECNTQLLELGRPAWNKWKRDAWVLGHTSEQGISWEPHAEGFTAEHGCGADVPPPPVPYGGGGLRLAARMQQQLLGLLRGGTAVAAGSGSIASGGPGPRGSQGTPAELPDAVAPPSCIATSADWCEVMQVVELDWELQRRGLSASQAAALLDAGLALRLTVHVGSRSDGLGQFCAGLVLDEGGSAAGGGEVPQMQSFVMRPSRHCYFSGRVRCGATDRWQRFEYTVPSCPRGFRRALVLLRGRRAAGPPPTEPLPTFCGAKFAAAELVFM